MRRAPREERRESRRAGSVFLVGAGPGDPHLMTLKGAALLREADVVVHDRLVPEEVLRLSGGRAKTVCVGKEPGGHTLTQEEINELLLREASAGRKVVRLKGGDPFLFGRGGEEMEYLTSRGVSVEVVPGVTSALAAPAYAGIPVTHRGVSRSLAVVTGRTCDGEADGVDWEGIARSCDTVVVLMGRGSLGEVVTRLLAGGLSPGTPAAAVQWGATASQRTVLSPLDRLEHAVIEAGLGAPMVLVVGEVVALREKLSWWERRPLFGKTVLLLRAAGQESGMACRLASLGARVVHVPAIHIRHNRHPSVEEALEGLRGFHWVVFTSPNAVTHFLQALRRRGKDARAFGDAKVLALGPATREALRDSGLWADLVPNRHSVEGIMEAFRGEDLRGVRFLLVRSDMAPSDLREFLQGKGASVREAHPYGVEVAEGPDPALIRRFRQGEIDVVLLTSPSTARGLHRLVGEDLETIARSAVGCIGPVTAEEAKRLGMQVAFTAEEHSGEGLVESLLRFLEFPGDE